jgi:hypothetical protein
VPARNTQASRRRRSTQRRRRLTFYCFWQITELSLMTGGFAAVFAFI